MASYSRYLVRRGHQYSFRLRIPRDLRRVLQANEVWKSLQTSDIEKAKPKAFSLASRFLALWNDLRGRMESKEPSLSELRQLARRRLKDILESPVLFTTGLPGEKRTPETVEDELDSLDLVQSDYREALALRAWHLVEPQAKELIADENLEINQGSEAWDSLCQSLMENAVISLDIARSRLQGRPREEARILRSLNGISAPAADTPRGSRMKMSELAKKWLHETKVQGRSEGTIREYDTAMRLFQELVGDVPLCDITRDSVRDYRDLLTKLPSNMRKKKAYRDLSVAEILEKGVPEADRLSITTVAKHVERLSTALGFAVEEGLIEKNHASGLAPQKDSINYKAFSDNELLAIFEPTAFLGEPKGYLWLPILGLYTGARLEELCGLITEEIDDDWDVPNIHVQERQHEGRKLKTASSARRIPIHDDLVELGFLAHVKRLRNNGQRELFPGVYSDKATKWFGRYREKIGMGGRKQGTAFHSFRSNFISRLTNKEVSTTLIKELVGHAHHDVTNRHYYSGPAMRDLKRALGRLEFKLDLKKKLKEITLGDVIDSE